MSEYLSELASILWGTTLLIFLLVCNAILMFYSKMIPIRGFMHALSIVAGKQKHDGDAEGQVSHFQALCNALAATVGLGNISGVAVAIYQGGPGAIFWMWVAALLGMNTKFFECTLAVMYRGKDFRGDIQGGPMYYIEQGLGEKFRPMAYFFAICGLIGTYSLFQVNQVAVFLNSEYSANRMVVGLSFAIVVGHILMGGLKRISQYTEKIVPAMAAIYMISCLVILFIHFEKIPGVFTSIITHAFGLESLGGGVAGYAVMHIVRTGVKRAAFSNEAGMGTAPMAHGNAKTAEPISEGYVAMLGPLIDTIVICTMTALVILVNMQDNATNLNGINLTSYAFVNSLGVYGRHILAVVIFLFAFSTMIGMANYNKKCWDYIFKGKFNLGNKTFVLVYIFTIALASVVDMGSIVDLIDIAFALMAIPNAIAIVMLGRKVVDALSRYNKKYIT